MTWLLLSIITNTLLLLILKGFERYGVNTLHGIVVNYAIAASTGMVFAGIPGINDYSEGAAGVSWIPFVLGFLFISIFFVLGRTAQVAGISIATVANKMSVVIPVLAAVLFYSESLGWIKIVGMAAALVAVWMTSKKVGTAFDFQYLLLPVVIFVGSGIIDALVNHLQKLAPQKNLIPFMLSLAFLSAFVIGVVTVAFRTVRHKESVTGRSIIGGIILGIPNYFSIYAITKALNSEIRFNGELLESSQLYPVNNMGIVICSALGAMIFFREKLSVLNWLGILLSIAAIAIIAFA